MGGKIVLFNHITLDGVIQGPGHPDEDRRGGFTRGGWAAANNDEVMMNFIGKDMARSSSLLFGRWTYKAFEAFWPKQPKPNPFTDVLNQTQKYVASKTLTEPLTWSNSTLLKGDAAEAVAALKPTLDKNLVILGSATLRQSLMRHRLIDELVLLVHPVVVGSGQRLFREDGDGVYDTLRLVDSVTTTKGVLIATYQIQVESA